MMQTLSYFQLKNFAEFLNTELLGAQLQDVWTNGEMLICEFYLQSEYYLVIDSQPQKPMICLMRSLPKLKKQPKPVSLFLNSHAVNLRLSEIEVQQDWGRIIKLTLANNKKSCQLEIQLIPRSFNILVNALTEEGSHKKIAWAKPKDLPVSTVTALAEDIGQTDWFQFAQDWWQEKFSSKENPQQKTKSAEDIAPANSSIELQKKLRILANLQKSISDEAASGSANKWRQLGEALKFSKFAELSEELKSLYNQKLGISENREKAFSQAKHIEAKQEKIEKRIVDLQKEIARLESGEQAPVKVSNRKGLLEHADAKGRKLKIKDLYEAVIGKSGADNLAILRKSQPWDLWLHLKDYPGAHAIISRPRNKEVPLEVIEQVAKWVIKESFSNKNVDLGQKYDVLVVETRFVRPIKGDKLGRVTFQNSKVYSFSA